MCESKNPCEILFVEDSAEIVNAAAEFAQQYENLGVHFFFAASIAEAKTYLLKRNITIIILDLTLHDSSGPQTLISMVELTKEKKQPIYVYTGDYGAQKRLELLKHGAREVFFKSDISLLNTVVFARHAANEERKTQRILNDRDLYKGSAVLLQNKCDALQEELDFIKEGIKEDRGKQAFNRFERKLRELTEGVKHLAASN